MQKKAMKIFVTAAVAIAGIIFLCVSGKQDAVTVSETSLVQDLSASENDDLEKTEPESGIWVYISGYVKNPGVYYLDKGSRLFEAVEMAGGILQDAANDAVNLALVLEDGQHIYIPGPEDTESFDTDRILSSTDDGLVNINTASAEELKSLPGIGDAKAQAIIDYRKKTPFLTIEEIMNVSGIKENSFEKIKNRIKV